MSRQKLEKARPLPPSALERLRSEIGAADRFITLVTWSCAAGMVLWSMLNATPYVRAHVAVGWEDTAFVLPLVVDAAFVGALRADEIASRHGVRAGAWPVLLRLFTGAASVFLNIGGSAEAGDRTGVFQHLVAPGLLVLLAEAGPAWRRSLAAKLTAAERTAEREERQQADRARRERQEDEDRQADAERREDERQRTVRREEEDRLREQRRQDEREDEDRRERAAASAQAREIERQRLALEAKKLELAARPAPARTQIPPAPRVPATPATPATPEAAAGVWAGQSEIRRSSTVSAAPGAAAPQPRPEPVTVSAAQSSGRARVTARVEPVHQEQPAARPQPSAGPVKDWDLPGLPADCAPGREPALLTDSQAHARIGYGHANGWAQRRVATFAGRSPSTVHKHMKALDTE